MDLDPRCRVDMLGGLRLVREDAAVTRFRTRKTAELLGYLACHRSRAFARDELLERLWPEIDPETGRGYLRTTLAYLRRPLEPPGVQFNSVLQADRSTVRLNPDAVATDVAEFEAAQRTGDRAREPRERIAALCRAVELYRGDLLPGFYEDWVDTARMRLAEAHQRVLRDLAATLAATGDAAKAIEYAHRAAAADPLSEEAHLQLVELYDAEGRGADALEVYERFARRLRDELDDEPGPVLQARARRLAGVAPAARRKAATSSAPVACAATPNPPTRLAPPAGIGGEGADARGEPRLPRMLDRFFGREAEMETIAAVLADPDPRARLVTLTGPGGAGKTRLAVECGWRLEAVFGCAIWFVPLGDAVEGAALDRYVAAALRVGAEPGETAIDQVVRALSAQPSLLILDNLEQVAESGAVLVDGLLRSVEHLRCLVTSRRCLGVTGEREIGLAPLEIPPGHAPPERMMEHAAVRLFVGRAQQVRPDFQVTARNTAHVADVIRRLDGIPLAIELAAARARILTPAQIAMQIGNRFDLLVDRRAAKDSRHRSLRAAVEWSFHLLMPEAQRLLGALTVFAGGWSLEAAAAVSGRDDVVDLLEELRVNSLIQAADVTDAAGASDATEASGEMRYRMLETVRAFAAERVSKDLERRAERRHAEYFAEVADTAFKELFGARQSEWLDRLQLDLENLRAAMDRSLADVADARAGLRLSRGLCRFWQARGMTAEGLERSLAALDHAVQAGWGASEADSELRLLVDTLNSAGGVALAADRFDDAARLHAEAENRARAIGYTRGLAVSLDNMGVVEARRGAYREARRLYEESLAIHRSIGNAMGVRTLLAHLGHCAQKAEDFAAADTYYRDAIELFRAVDDRLQLATTLSNLGMVCEQRGEREEARRLYEEGLAIHESMGNRAGAALCAGNLGVMAHRAGDHAAGRERLDACIAVFRELGMNRALAIALACLASVEESASNRDRARRLHEESLAMHRSLGAADGVLASLTTLGRFLVRDGEYSAARGHLREAIAAARADGLPLATAQVLEACAELCLALGDAEEAARYCGAADSVRDSVGAPAPPDERSGLTAAICAALGADAADAAFADGRGRPLEEAVGRATRLLAG